MSRLLGKELTEALLNRLNGRNVEAYEGKIIPIFTLDEFWLAASRAIILL